MRDYIEIDGDKIYYYKRDIDRYNKIYINRLTDKQRKILKRMVKKPISYKDTLDITNKDGFRSIREALNLKLSQPFDKDVIVGKNGIYKIKLDVVFK